MSTFFKQLAVVMTFLIITSPFCLIMAFENQTINFKQGEQAYDNLLKEENFNSLNHEMETRKKESDHSQEKHHSSHHKEKHHSGHHQEKHHSSHHQEKHHKGSKGDRGSRGDRGSKGDRGSSGPQGPAGSPGVSFVVDVGQTLEFSFNLVVNAGDTGSSLVPYIIAPDGKMTQLNPQMVISGTNVIPNITINNPLFGSYTVGLQTSSGISVIGGNLILTVFATRDPHQSHTIIFNNPINVGLPSNECQTSAIFAYGTGNVP